MTDLVGQTILRYKVIEKIGQGGMGVVYKAEDTKLKRQVAIKFLPQNIAANEEERKRFEIEAQAAASLNHPNIATIHSIEETDNEIFIVMEYIEGVELKEKLKTGALPYDQINNIAIQIAEGLEAAHNKGIIHRDIKSSNVMITDSGIVKIMDFGLAKIKGGSELTKMGTTVGTIAYMSPEQARGEKVDKRTDIWSFGVVLYEMISGNLPFKGEYDQAIIYSIMNLEPETIKESFPAANAGLIQIIRKALEKDIQNRYHSMSDVISDFGNMIGKTSATISKHEQRILNRSGTRKQKTEVSEKQNLFRSLVRNRVIQIGAGIFIIVVVWYSVWLFSGPSLPTINPNRSFSDIQIPLKNFDYPTLSPDGKMLAIAGSDINGNWDIYLMDIKSGESRKLNIEKSSTINNDHISAASFSPDGSIISFGARNPKTRIQKVCDVSVLGGFVRVIADTGIGSYWGPKGDRIYYFRGKPRAPSRSGWREYWSVSPDGGDAHLEFIDSLLQGADDNLTFSLSPDGKKAAFTRPFKGNFNEIIVRNLDTGKETRLTHDHKIIDDLLWIKNGYIIFNSNRGGNSNIWAISAEGGKPKQITNEAFHDYAMSYSSIADRLVFQQTSITGTLWKVKTDGSDNKQVVSDLNVWDAAISPDGEKAAIITFVNPTIDINKSLVMRNLTSSQTATLLPANSYKVGPKWSPSGRYLAYSVFKEGPAVDYGVIKILDLAEGNGPRDFGYGEIRQWPSDSVAVIACFSGYMQPDYKHLGGRGKRTHEDSTKYINISFKILNIKTGKERKFFRDSTVFAMPVLNNSKYLYNPRHTSDLYLVSKKELNKNPDAKGKFIIDARKAGIRNSAISNEWFYYFAKNTIWKINLKTLKIAKIIDLPKTNFLMGFSDNNDKFLTYVKHETKIRFIKIDNLFLK